jgi:hypothetical protein
MSHATSAPAKLRVNFFRSAVNVTVEAGINVNLFMPISAANGNSESRGQPFAVRLVVAVPTAQGGVAGVGK